MRIICYSSSFYIVPSAVQRNSLSTEYLGYSNADGLDVTSDPPSRQSTETSGNRSTTFQNCPCPHSYFPDTSYSSRAIIRLEVLEERRKGQRQKVVEYLVSIRVQTDVKRLHICSFSPTYRKMLRDLRRK